MAVITQYHIVATGLYIKLGADSRGIRQARILTRPAPKEMEINYDLDYGFKESELLELKQTKLLSNG